MKKLLPFILLISMFSCTKDDNTPGNNNNNNNSNSNNNNNAIVAYEVGGVHDFALQNNKATTQALTLSIARNNDTAAQETVSMHISGIPEDISVDSSGGLNGTPPFT